MSLSEEIEELLRAPVQRTTFGLTGWIEGAEAIQRRADEMDAADFQLAIREMIFALDAGKQAAIMRLAERIEEQDGPSGR